MNETSRIVIVGAGHAGGTTAALLRQYGHVGPIALVGAEPHPPYQRPPLSKAWLKGQADHEALSLKPCGWYGDNAVDLLSSRTATAIERAEGGGGRVYLSGEAEPLIYDFLVLATGARARALPIEGCELTGVLTLRDIQDAERLKDALTAEGRPRRLAIIGGGYVGLEAAASARALGAAVTIIEREHRILARVACPILSAFFEARHREQGVDFRMDAGVRRLIGEGGKATGVEFDDGSVLACDLVLIGVGAIPNDELVRAAGLVCDDGVVVDLAARTSDPTIHAVGDVTRRPLPRYDRMARLESVPNALEQAKQAACAILGRPAPEPETPWFWSDQYELKLQIAGLPFGCDDMVVRGDPGRPGFALFHMAGDIIQAVEAVNAPAEFMLGRQWIGRRTPVARERLADPNIPMKAVLQ